MGLSLSPFSHGEKGERPPKVHMKKPKSPAAATVDWPSIRLRYEARDEPVADIAASIGWGPKKLANYAKTQGWLLRTGKAKLAAPEAKPITSTKEAINRLKLVVQRRISKLEEAHNASDDKEVGMNAANLLARTLEKVLELEEQQRKHSKLAAAQRGRSDDAWRSELAGRIARLAFGRSGESIDSGGGENPAAGLAALGEA